MRRFGEFLWGHEDGRALRAGIELGAKAGFAHGNIRACPAHAATEFNIHARTLTTKSDWNPSSAVFVAELYGAHLGKGADYV